MYYSLYNLNIAGCHVHPIKFITHAVFNIHACFHHAKMKANVQLDTVTQILSVHGTNERLRVLDL